jgi:superfamily II DNA or RNA helicase
MQHSVRLRPWQKRALEAFRAQASPDFLAVATPGAGKTTFALTAAALDLADHPGRRLVVVAPTQHLKLQWAAAADRFGLHLEPSWSPRDGRLPTDLHGVVVTYQQVAQQAHPLSGLARDAFVVLDEIHHAGDERAWGDGVRTAFEGAARRLSLSGTPFRSDETPIPFVRYDWGQAATDFEYGYADALVDGSVVRPVWFPRIDGHMEWVAPDGEQHAHGFDDPLDRTRSNQRLRAALSLGGEWLPAVLDQAHAHLVDVRARQPDAGGLVIAIDHDHARGIVELLRRRHGVHATLVLSDDPGSSRRIEHFAAGDQPWLVAVRMVSEGVDIPRLRVGVFATNTTTELFFRQAVGRLVRWRAGGGRRQKAVMFIPDDVRLRTHAGRIAEARRHLLQRERTAEDDLAADLHGAELDEATGERDEAEQLNLFEVLSATAVGIEGDGDRPEWLDDEEDDDGAGDDQLGADDDDLVITLAPPAPPGGRRPGGFAGGGLSPREQRERLRDANADRVLELVRLTGLGHAKVNGELNRLAGVGRVSEATNVQLQQRLTQADRWLDRLVGRRRTG